VEISRSDSMSLTDITGNEKEQWLWNLGEENVYVRFVAVRHLLYKARSGLTLLEDISISNYIVAKDKLCL
jgi:hypothetical protein